MRHPLDDRLLTVLPADAVYAVGGRVRDELRQRLGQTRESGRADLDYVVTGLAIDDLVARLRTLGKVDVVGASFAVVKLWAAEGEADIALPRRERSTGVGHRDFAVQSGPEVSLEEDLGRRDFRINAIARRISDELLVDPHDGVADVEARRIDILGERTFEEDPLRLLRAAQFSARFRYALSPGAIAGMVRSAELVASVSAERIHDELVKLLGAGHPSIGFSLLAETGVLQRFWPELLEGDRVNQNRWHRFDVFRHSLATLDATPPGDLVLRLAALLHDVGKPRTKDGPHFYRHELVGEDLTRAMLERLRFSHETIDAVSALVRHHMYATDPAMSGAAVRRFIRRVGPRHVGRLFELRAADIAGSGLPKRDDQNERFEERVHATIGEAPPFSIADLAVGGADVIDAMRHAGLAGPDFKGDERVGEALRWAFEQVTDEPDRNDRSQLRALLDAYFSPGGSRS